MEKRGKMDCFDKRQNILWEGAQELATDVYDPDLYLDDWEDLAEQIYFEMCEEEGIDPYA